MEFLLGSEIVKIDNASNCCCCYWCNIRSVIWRAVAIKWFYSDSQQIVCILVVYMGQKLVYHVVICKDSVPIYS